MRMPKKSFWIVVDTSEMIPIKVAISRLMRMYEQIVSLPALIYIHFGFAYI
jgi:hypothetical protein